MKIEDMNDSDKKTSASKPFKSNGGSEPQTTKEQVIILRTEVRQVGKTVDKLVVTVDANHEKFLAMLGETNARMDANQKDANARMDANQKDANARMDANQKDANARMDANREEIFARMDANQRETNARMDAMREEFLAMLRETNARMDANQKETNARMDANQRETNARMDANQRETNARFDAMRKEIFKVQLLGAVILAVLLMDSPLAGRVFDKFGLGAGPPAVRQDVSPPQAEEVLAATDSSTDSLPAQPRRADASCEAPSHPSPSASAGGDAAAAGGRGGGINFSPPASAGGDAAAAGGRGGGCKASRNPPAAHL